MSFFPHYGTNARNLTPLGMSTSAALLTLALNLVLCAAIPSSVRSKQVQVQESTEIYTVNQATSSSVYMACTVRLEGLTGMSAAEGQSFTDVLAKYTGVDQQQIKIVASQLEAASQSLGVAFQVQHAGTEIALSAARAFLSDLESGKVCKSLKEGMTVSKCSVWSKPLVFDLAGLPVVTPADDAAELSLIVGMVAGCVVLALFALFAMWRWQAVERFTIWWESFDEVDFEFPDYQQAAKDETSNASPATNPPAGPGGDDNVTVGLGLGRINYAAEKKKRLDEMVETPWTANHMDAQPVGGGGGVAGYDGWGSTATATAPEASNRPQATLRMDDNEPKKKREPSLRHRRSPRVEMPVDTSVKDVRLEKAAGGDHDSAPIALGNTPAHYQQPPDDSPYGGVVGGTGATRIVMQEAGVHDRDEEGSEEEEKGNDLFADFNREGEDALTKLMNSGKKEDKKHVTAPLRNNVRTSTRNLTPSQDFKVIVSGDALGGRTSSEDLLSNILKTAREVRSPERDALSSLLMRQAIAEKALSSARSSPIPSPPPSSSTPNTSKDPMVEREPANDSVHTLIVFDADSMVAFEEGIALAEEGVTPAERARSKSPAQARKHSAGAISSDTQGRKSSDTQGRKHSVEAMSSDKVAMSSRSSDAHLLGMYTPARRVSSYALKRSQGNSNTSTPSTSANKDSNQGWWVDFSTRKPSPLAPPTHHQSPAEAVRRRIMDLHKGMFHQPESITAMAPMPGDKTGAPLYQGAHSLVGRMLDANADQVPDSAKPLRDKQLREEDQMWG